MVLLKLFVQLLLEMGGKWPNTDIQQGSGANVKVHIHACMQGGRG